LAELSYLIWRGLKDAASSKFGIVKIQGLIRQDSAFLEWAIKGDRMRKQFTTRRRIAVVSAVVVGVLAVGGVAFAYFTSTGSGTGQATVGTASNWTVTAGSPSGTMYPGQGSTTIVFTVQNAGTGNQQDNGDSVAVAHDGSGNVTSHGTAVPGCLATWFTASKGTDNAQGVDFTPSESQTVTVTVTMSDANVSQDACQGVTPDITLSVN
jgi:hypothetical protein